MQPSKRRSQALEFDRACSRRLAHRGPFPTSVAGSPPPYQMATRRPTEEGSNLKRSNKVLARKRLLPDSKAGVPHKKDVSVKMGPFYFQSPVPLDFKCAIIHTLPHKGADLGRNYLH